MTFYQSLERLRIAAQGRDNRDNLGNMRTDTSNGGVHLVYVRVSDLALLLEDYQRLDRIVRAERLYERGIADSVSDI